MASETISSSLPFQQPGSTSAHGNATASWNQSSDELSFLDSLLTTNVVVDANTALNNIIHSPSDVSSPSSTSSPDDQPALFTDYALLDSNYLMANATNNASSQVNAASASTATQSANMDFTPAIPTVLQMSNSNDSSPKKNSRSRGASTKSATKDNGPSKKRRRKTVEEEEITLMSDNDEDIDDSVPVAGDIGTVSLPKDTLLKMSSAQLNEFINRLASQLSREFSKPEQAEIARMKRLVRNRESAQASRQRKKDKLDELETRVAKLESEKREIAQYAARLEVENGRLKQELARLHGSGATNTASSHTTLQLNAPLQHGKPLMNDKMKKFGTTLLVLCFTFGILMRTQVQPNNAASAEVAADFRFPPEAIPEVAAGPVGASRILQQHNKLQHNAATRAFTVARDIKQVDQQETASIEELVDTPMSDSAAAVAKASPSPTKRLTIESPLVPADFVNSSVPHTAMDNASESPLTEYLSGLAENKKRPNTAVMTCSDLRQIVPPNSAPLNSDDPLYISLLVPPTKGVNANVDDAQNGTQFVEITCQVMDIKTVTLFNGDIIATQP